MEKTNGSARVQSYANSFTCRNLRMVDWTINWCVHTGDWILMVVRHWFVISTIERRGEGNTRSIIVHTYAIAAPRDTGVISYGIPNNLIVKKILRYCVYFSLLLMRIGDSVEWLLLAILVPAFLCEFCDTILIQYCVLMNWLSFETLCLCPWQHTKIALRNWLQLYSGCRMRCVLPKAWHYI